jgi:hypothetical protein
MHYRSYVDFSIYLVSDADARDNHAMVEPDDNLFSNEDMTY